jgi:hypothetical protein
MGLSRKSIAPSWTGLEVVDDGDRQMVDLLSAVLTDGLTAVEAA